LYSHRKIRRSVVTLVFESGTLLEYVSAEFDALIESGKAREVKLEDLPAHSAHLYPESQSIVTLVLRVDCPRIKLCFPLASIAESYFCRSFVAHARIISYS
jgi:hypothetical protein